VPSVSCEGEFEREECQKSRSALKKEVAEILKVNSSASERDVRKELTCEAGGATETDSHPLPSGRDCAVKTFKEKRQLVEDLKKQWRTLWRERIDDKVRAEGISNKDFSQLFVERGTIIMATRKFKPPDFYEILQQHLSSDTSDINGVFPPNPTVGGWGRFIRTVLSRQQLLARRRRIILAEPVKKAGQQLKKGGRGWLHFKR